MTVCSFAVHILCIGFGAGLGTKWKDSQSGKPDSAINGVAVENGIQNPLSFLRQFLRLVSVRYVLVNLRFRNTICPQLVHEVNTHCTNLLHN